MRWAFIGASNIASQWMVDAVRSVGDEVLAVVSRDAARAQAFADRHGIAHALTDEAGLQALGVQAVYISSTNEKHEASVLRAAGSGLHVLCEKPLATSLESAQRMVRACADAGVTLASNFHLRHNLAHQQMHDAVQSGALGTLVSVRLNHSVFLPQHLQGWRLTDKVAGGGVVLDIAVHNADSLAFILGEYPARVTALTSNSGMGQGLEDNAMSLWHFPSGVTAFTHQGFATPYGEKGIELLGTRATLKGVSMLDQGAPGTLTWMSKQGATTNALEDRNLYTQVLTHFHQALRGAPHHMADGVAGLKALAVALAILESARTGTTVAVDYGAPQDSTPQGDWQCAAVSHDLPAHKPLAVTLDGKAIVLYRQANGAPVAMDDRCPHRWSPLSDGRVEGDHIVCPQHGFQFCPRGHLVQAPGQASMPGVGSARVYPVLEKDQAIWIQLAAPDTAA